MRSKNESISRLLEAADLLEELTGDLVFTGGATLCLLITDISIMGFRPTNDFDFVINVATRMDYYNFLEKLREKGFSESPEEQIICRMKTGNVVIDVMPTAASVLGFSNSWYEGAYAHPWQYTLENHQLRIISAPYFLATKLEAFYHRGNNDYMASHDMEDIIALVDGREELISEIDNGDPEIRIHLVKEMSTLLKNPAFLSALSGHLPPDGASQQRISILENRLKKIASLSLKTIE